MAETSDSRIGGYPEWDAWRLRDLREFRATLSVNQVKARLTGRELEAALSDPRWQVLDLTPPARTDRGNLTSR